MVQQNKRRGEARLTYIDYLNDFHRWLSSNHLPGSARLLYYSLLAVFNEAGWPESVQVDNYRLMSMIDVRTERVAISARDKLVSFGFIRYSRGKKGCPNTYFLTRYTGGKVSPSGSRSGSGSGSVPVSPSDRPSGSHIKTKTKTKKKTKEISPGGEMKRAAAVVDAYLDKVGAYLSERGREELAGFAEVMGEEVCLRAIDTALDAKKAHWPYIRAILESKQSQGVRCLADWDALEEKRRGAAGKTDKPWSYDPGSMEGSL